MKTIRVYYYAALREQSGLGEEAVQTSASSPEDLYGELALRHGFQLHAHQLKVAVNDDFCDWRTILRDGDRVVFVPPVAGG